MDFELEEDPPETVKKAAPRVEALTKPISPRSVNRDRTEPPKSQIPWKKLRWASRIALYLGLALYLWGTYAAQKFDHNLKIDPLVRRNPLQIDAPVGSFLFPYRGHEYVVQPVADYEIAGLVVTHNDISSIMDAYHTSDSVDFRDICLVWGVNVSSNVFRRATFFSMPWSCHVKFNDQNAADSFVYEQISNNHLLTDNESVRKKILEMRVGDQVYFRGKLINYWPKGQSELARNTSLVRTDTGNGACEVLWVDEARILKRADSNWDTARSLGISLLFGAILVSATIFLLAPLGA